MSHGASSNIMIFLVVLFTVAPSFSQNSVPIGPLPPEVTKERGLLKVTFVDSAGKIKVFLPDDMAVGDTISGTVTIEANGSDDKEWSKNQNVLNGYVIDFGDGNKVQANRPRFTWTHQISKPSPPARHVIRIVEVFGQNGKPVSSVNVPINTRVSVVPSRFSLPPTGQTGRPIVIAGPFDGDASNTKCSIGGTSLLVIAESPRQTICTSPVTVVGVTDIKISEGNRKTTGQIRNIGVNLTAPKTNLTKGENTTLTVSVTGLRGITSNIPIQLVTTGSINTQGGNTQTIQIKPSMVDTNGVSIQTFTLDAIQSGSFNVTATVQPAMQRKP
jgi:hypothetical protein